MSSIYMAPLFFYFTSAFLLVSPVWPLAFIWVWPGIMMHLEIELAEALRDCHGYLRMAEKFAGINLDKEMMDKTEQALAAYESRGA